MVDTERSDINNSISNIGTGILLKGCGAVLLSGVALVRCTPLILKLNPTKF